MFRRYPYWGWLLLCLLLWSINGYYYHIHRQEALPERMARAVTTDLQNRENAFDLFLRDTVKVSKLFDGGLPAADVNYICDLPFYVFAYDNNTLKFWNTNTILPTPSDSTEYGSDLLRTDRGVYVRRLVAIPPGDRLLVVLYPVLASYPVENDYLKSQFIASDLIPVNTRIIPPNLPAPGAYTITAKDNTPAFHLLFNIQDVQKWVPDLFFIVMLLAALLASISWIHLMIIHLTRNRSSLTGFIATLLVIITIRVYLYLFGVPFNLDTLMFFSPQLYASSVYLSSFGDLFINTLCILWLVVFVTRHTPYKTYFERIQNSRMRAWIPFLLVAVMISYLLLYVTLVRSLVLDSSISFDVSRFYSIDIYTILGLLVICIITGISSMIIYLFNFQLRQLVPDKGRKYLLTALTGAAFLALSGHYNDLFYWSLLGWLLLFIVLLDIPKLTLVSDLFEPQMIFWALFICTFCTAVLQYFSAYKEKESRKAFVEQRLAPHRDNVLEYTFDKTINNIATDAVLKTFFYEPDAQLRKVIARRFDTMYLKGAAASYDAGVYLYDNEGKALYNSDSTDYYSFVFDKNESVPTPSPYLFYKESMPDKHSYLSYIPVYADTINNRIGYVVIDLKPKKQAATTVYPELLLPPTGKTTMREEEYSYAVYVNGRLTNQARGYSFPTFLSHDTLKDQDFRFYTVNGVSELHYKMSDKRTIVAVHDHNTFLEVITFFSYLFSIQVFIAVIILLYQLYLSYFTHSSAPGKYVRLTLRKRIQYAMLAIVFVSFVFIGVVTIWFFSSSYRNSNSTKLSSAMQNAKLAVQNYLSTARAYENDTRFDSVTQSNGFRTFITGVAASQKIDINLYDNNGHLFASSQEEIYQKGLIARVMRPDAYNQLNARGRSLVLQREQVAGLSYLSAYEPLRNEHGVALGFLNVPFFSSEKDLNFQISNIVITLINVYAFIFLISSLITVSITRWVTGSFNVIIAQFGRLNLQQNERITWPYDDEIGLLVEEYNKMVNKVEENAALLAQSERETAWREMARQVAHEIKNPLTPMKLNIQYLLQAIKGDNPNIKALTLRVSESIIEQIDNLSYIASEFSNFAKMPEARPEDLELGALLTLATGLYTNEAHCNLKLELPAEKIYTFSDHSQLLRMLTNLLENAKQAIPADREGLIEVALKAEDGHALITITDNGHGISDEVAQRIFQPYFTTKSSGTGLGLAMTRKIIEFWKGSIWFESEEGKGTTFFVRLPVHSHTV
jgi:signal transduction histidine kinase